MARSILVTGFTGRLGALVAARLRDLGAAPTVLVRPGRLAGDDWRMPEGITVISGDYEDSPSLAKALDGIDAVFLVSPVHPEMRRRELALAAAAAAHGPPPHIVKVSGLCTRPDSFVDSGRWHAEIEAGIRDLGVAATFLRPNFFMQNLAFQGESIRYRGVLRGAVGDARIAMVDARDIADVAASVLLGGSPLEGEAVSLTSARNYSYEEVAEALTALLPKRVVYQRQTSEEVAAALAQSGQPEWHVNILLAFNEAFARGWGEAVTDAVERALGRPARTLEAFLAELVAGSAASGRDPFSS